MHDETKCYPFVKCEHCRCKECWDSVPQEDFVIKENDIDEDGNILQTTHEKTINEITLDRGHDLEDVRGWTF